MKILIWGVPCVGKTKIAPLLANKLNYKFIDINTLIKEKYQTIDKFYKTFPNDCDIKIKKILIK